MDKEEGAQEAPPPTFYQSVLQITRARMNNTLHLLLDETRCAIVRAAQNGTTVAFIPRTASRPQVEALAKYFRGEGFKVINSQIEWEKDI